MDATFCSIRRNKRADGLLRAAANAITTAARNSNPLAKCRIAGFITIFATDAGDDTIFEGHPNHQEREKE
jgi:hypothetical protein